MGKGPRPNPDGMASTNEMANGEKDSNVRIVETGDVIVNEDLMADAGYVF